MVELPSDRRGFLDRMNWENFQEHQDTFPIGTVLVALTLVLTIMAIFLSSQGESRTGDEIRWSFFILLVIILCIVAIRWLYPKNLRYDEMDYSIDLQDGEFKKGINKAMVEGALEGRLFSQVNMLLDLREALANRVMTRHHMSKTDLQNAIEEDRLGPLVGDLDMAWILKGSMRDFEELLKDESNGIRANFYVWFADMLRKVEEWH
jgi:hypothetical protein